MKRETIRHFVFSVIVVPASIIFLGMLFGSMYYKINLIDFTTHNDGLPCLILYFVAIVVGAIVGKETK